MHHVMPVQEVLSIRRYPVDFNSDGEALLKICSTSLFSVGSGGEYCNAPLQVLAFFFHGLDHDQLLTLLCTTIMPSATLSSFYVHICMSLKTVMKISCGGS